MARELVVENLILGSITSDSTPILMKLVSVDRVLKMIPFFPSKLFGTGAVPSKIHLA